MRRIALCLLCLLTTPPLLARSLGVHVQSAAPPPMLGYYVDASVALRLDFHGVDHCAQVAAGLYQQAAVLEVSLEQPSALACNDAPGIGGSLGASFRFTVPPVERTTRLEWRFSHCPSPGGPCTAVGAVSFTAYPGDLLSPIAEWAVDNVVQVLDASGGLQATFETHGVEFLEYGAPLPSQIDVVSLAVGPVDEEIVGDLLASGPVMVFRERRPGLPLVLLKPAENGPMIDVRVPVVERLSSDPAAVQTLLDLFRLLLGRPAPAG